MARVNPEDVAEIVRCVAREHITPRFGRLGPEDSHEKTPGERVTEVDRAAEAALIPALRSLIAGSAVIGEEESHGRDYARELAEHPAVWLIDPLDGTENFIMGRPIFALMVGLVSAGECIASWIYDPLTDTMAIAERGAGARVSGRRVYVAPPTRGTDLRGSAYQRFLPLGLRESVARGAARLGARAPLGCAGHEYVSLVTGRRDFVLYYRMLPWDHAPGVLLFEEAGGYARRYDGQAYRAGDGRPGLLAAPDEETWRSLHHAFFGG